jgi:hypothetical protein
MTHIHQFVNAIRKLGEIQFGGEFENYVAFGEFQYGGRKNKSDGGRLL